MRILSVLALLMTLSACAAEVIWASQESVSEVRYRDPGGPKLTLLTMVNNETGAGAHTSLMVSASERVIFDPAGSFKAQSIPEREDVLYGITPAAFAAYRGSHARISHHVVVQDIDVTAEQAELALRLVMANGAVANAFCTNSTSSILSRIPGLDDIKVTFYPVKLATQLEGRPGVTTTRYYENDSADLNEALAKL